MSGTVLIGLVTAPDEAVAATIVETLLQEKLIACGNIAAGIRSHYRWQGKLERADEILIILKTTAQAADQVVARVRDLHPYDVPEVLFFPVTSGYEPYMQWVRDNVV